MKRLEPDPASALMIEKERQAILDAGFYGVTRSLLLAELKKIETMSRRYGEHMVAIAIDELAQKRLGTVQMHPTVTKDRARPALRPLEQSYARLLRSPKVSAV